MDRFLFSFPDPPKAASESWKTIPEDVKAGYTDAFNIPLDYELVADSGSRGRPFFVEFDKSGRTAWEEFTENIAARMNALEPFDPFKGVIAKLKGYAVRFSILLWTIRAAGGDANTVISADILAGADALVSYFEKHAARCLGRGWADRTSRIAVRLLAWLSRNEDRGGFSRREAFQHLKDQRDVKAADVLDPVFKLLVDHGYIRPVSLPVIRTGPVPEVYTVNRDWDRSPGIRPPNPP